MTSYEQVNDWFFALIEKDWEFFNYYDVPADQAVAIANKRADNLRKEAVRLICTKCLPQINFSEENEDGTGFAFDFTPQEELLVPMVMLKFYLARDIAKLKSYDVNFTASEIKVFDPSNQRRSFMEMYLAVSEETAQLLDDYKNSDRETGQYKPFNPKLYDIE